jgi:hypothetical protein
MTPVFAQRIPPWTFYLAAPAILALLLRRRAAGAK